VMYSVVSLFLIVVVLVCTTKASSYDDCETWYDKTEHGPSFRNVKDYGAKGDGVTDDTAAIIRALTEGVSPTFSDATRIVYVPTGTYKISGTIPLYFGTQFVGNFKCRPKIVLAPNSPGFNTGRKFVLEATYGGSEHTSNFYHQIHNFEIEISSGNSAAVVIHWAVAQATSLRNLKIDVGSGDMAVFAENGSGGFMSDLDITGGNIGLQIGGQQWTFRNIKVTDTRQVGVAVIWNWVFSTVGISVTNSPVGIQFQGGASTSMTILDASFTNCGTCVTTDYPKRAQAILLDRVTTNKCAYIVDRSLQGNANGEVKVNSWRQGPAFSKGKALPAVQGNLPSNRPDKNLVQKQRPDFDDGSVANVRTFGAKGDGKSDDTEAIQKAIDSSDSVFFPAGVYLISDTIKLKTKTALIGEAWSTLMGKAGSSAFMNDNDPTAMLLLPDDRSCDVRMANLLLSLQGDLPGCIILRHSSGSLSTWDVHYRLDHGGWGMVHMTDSAGGYIENMWGWTADHDIVTGKNITVKNARGFLCESSGDLIMYGTAFEHSYMYQYNFTKASNVIMLLTQTETPYWQDPPSSPAMHIKESRDIHLYGSGFYSWFHGTQKSVFEVYNSPDIYLYANNVHGVNELISGDYILEANYTSSFTSYFLADVPY